jgi:prolipoprotein diacylglyceryl transferase
VTTPVDVLALIPSPTRNVWYLGPVPIRAYALCIIAGIIAAVYITERRLRARGGPPGIVTDIAVWAVPFGIVGARVYHVLTSPDDYFGPTGSLLKAFEIWNGGLGIWGAVAGGALGAWLACKQRGLPLTVFADALAPGLAVAQAIGRLGNWFNNELYGRATDAAWGLQVHRMDPAVGRAVEQLPGAYHPTFLYEALWCLGVAALVWWADRRFRLGRGRAFALYAMAYVVGRFWIEALRIDEAKRFFAGDVDFLGPWFHDGIRLNDITSVVVFVGALIYFVARRGPRERIVVEDDGQVRVLPDDEHDGSPTAAGGGAAPAPDASPPSTDATAPSVAPTTDASAPTAETAVAPASDEAAPAAGTAATAPATGAAAPAREKPRPSPR